MELIQGGAVVAQDRDDAAFDAFVAARLPHLLRLGRALTGDEQRGADLVQDALERALVRRERPVSSAVGHEPPHVDRPPDRELLAAVRALPPRQRAVIALRYYEDLTEAQTAEVLGCTVGTVKSQANRAMQALRQQLPTFADTGETS